MEKLSKLAMDYPLCEGACLSGIATKQSLEGGPASTDLEYGMKGAKSAVVFAVPLDQSLIPDYLGKKDRLAFETNYERTNSLASGVAVKLSNYLTQKGHPAVPLAANDVYRDDTPNGRIDMMPPVSLRYLAVAAGVGSFGLSGNVITDEHGAGVILGAVLTSADLLPTSSIEEKDNYCDECKMCLNGCASQLMNPEIKTVVTMGGKTFTYSERNHYMRCQYVCGGFTGIHPSGKWSTWSPGRFAIPDKDEEIAPVFLASMDAYNKRPEGPGGHYHSLMDSKLYNTCANCQLFCVPEKKERTRRYKLLTNGGVVVQNSDGTLDAVPPEEAGKLLNEMKPEVRALYEGDIKPNPELMAFFKSMKPVAAN
ncbi:MAG: epoxyqueuosine reductase [Deltaproteobacteria bacterium]|nr:epoxyqueuosine reductase [Deltaproteobacteria bacterium]